MGGDGDRRAAQLLTVVALAGIAAVAVVAASTSVYGIDCYFYLAKARSLGRLGPLTPNFGGVDRRYLPGYSVALAPFHAAFGENGYLVFAGAVLAATLAVGYRLGRRLGLPAEAAAWGSALGALTPVGIQWSALPIAEPLGALLVLGFLLVRARATASGRTRDLAAAGALLGCAVVVRAETALLGLLLAADLGAVVRAPFARAAGCLAAVLATAAALPATYVAWLAAHREPSAAATLYLRDVERYPVHLTDVPGNFVHQVTAMFDLRFADAVQPVVALGVAALRYLAVAALVAALVALRRSAAARTLLAPVLLFAGLHAFWFYQYERFAFLWAPEVGLLLAWLVDGARRRAASVRSDRALRVFGAALAAAALLAGMEQGRAHGADLLANESSVDYRAVGRAFRVDPRCRAGVLAWPKPHFAYHADLPVWFDRGDADFVRADLPPGGFEPFAARTGVRCVATVDEPARWMASAGVAPSRAAAAVVEKHGVVWKIVLPP